MLRLPGTCRGCQASQVGLGTGAAVCVGLGCWEVPCPPGPGTGRPAGTTCRWADLRVTPTASMGVACQSAAGVQLLWSMTGDSYR